MILAIDTATRWTGLALHDGVTVIAEYGWVAHQTQTVELAPAVADLLNHNQVQPAHLTGIAIAIGPGSYTGLRIGLGVAKGLALAYKTPLFAISTLDIVAASVDRGRVIGQLMTVVEAGRTRICAATYRWDRKGWVSAKPADIYNWEELLEKTTEATTFAGEITAEAQKLLRHAGRHIHQVNPASSVRRASCLAELGWYRFRKDKPDDVRTLTPVYLRNPEGA
jgi:tRNA threonylcarbamoyladenosine biosynthesis protein TsaB